MKKTGAFLLTYALEQIGVRHTFGIPGVHNTEIYDELNKSEKITPVLVTHEGGGAFMADGVSRTSDIGEVQFEGMAIATGAAYLAMRNDGEIETVIRRAMEIADTGRPVLVDVNVDYSKKTCLTKGAVKANLSRFPTAEKVRFIGRAIKRQILG